MIGRHDTKQSNKSKQNDATKNRQMIIDLASGDLFSLPHRFDVQVEEASIDDKQASRGGRA